MSSNKSSTDNDTNNMVITANKNTVNNINTVTNTNTYNTNTDNTNTDNTSTSTDNTSTSIIHQIDTNSHVIQQMDSMCIVNSDKGDDGSGDGGDGGSGDGGSGGDGSGDGSGGSSSGGGSSSDEISNFTVPDMFKNIYNNSKVKVIDITDTVTISNN
jgi:hypothetical protein